MEIPSASENSIARERTGEVRVKPSENKVPGQEEILSGEIQQQERTYNKTEMTKEIDHLNKLLGSKSSHLQFVLHDKLNEYYVQVVNDLTNEVIKEIPSKKVMDIVANFYEKLGIIVDKKI